MAQTPSAPLDIAAAFRAGWRGFVGNVGPLIIVALIVWLVTATVNWWAGETTGFVQLLWRLLSFFVAQIVSIVWISLALAIIDGREISSDSLLPSGGTLVSYVLASFLFSLMFGIGLVLLIIPGLIVAAVFGLYGWALIDDDLDPIAALQRSSEITRGHRWQLVAFVLAAIAVNLVGLLLLIVGVLVTSAVTLIAAAHVYRQLEGSVQPAI